MHFNFGWFNQSNLILVGVAAQLFGGIARSIFRRPRQQQQIDRIEQTVNDTLGQVAPVLTALQTTGAGRVYPAANTPLPSSANGSTPNGSTPEQAVGKASS